MSDLEYVPLNKRPTFLCNKTQLLDYIVKAINDNSPRTWVGSYEMALTVYERSGLLVEIDPENSIDEDVVHSYELSRDKSLRMVDLMYTAAGRTVHIGNEYMRVSVMVITNPMYKGPRIRCQSSVLKPKVFMPKMIDFFARAFFGKDHCSR